MNRMGSGKGIADARVPHARGDEAISSTLCSFSQVYSLNMSLNG